MEVDLVLNILFLRSPVLKACSFNSCSHYFRGTEQNLKHWKFEKTETFCFIIVRGKNSDFYFPVSFLPNVSLKVVIIWNRKNEKHALENEMLVLIENIIFMKVMLLVGGKWCRLALKQWKKWFCELKYWLLTSIYCWQMNQGGTSLDKA